MLKSIGYIQIDIIVNVFFSPQDLFKRRLENVDNLPTMLQVVKGKLAAQKELKISVEKTVETLSKKLKTLVRILI